MSKPPIAIPGTAKLIAMLRELDPASQARAIAGLQTQDPALAILACQCRFSYGDLPRLNLVSLEKFFRRLPERQWLSVWPHSPPRVQAALLKVLSPRRQKDFIGEAAALTGVTRAQSIRMQLRIGRLAQAMLSQGELVLEETTP